MSSFNLNVAQRVSVVVDTSQLPPGIEGVWIRVTAMAAMYPVNITGYVPPYEANTSAVPLDPAYLAWIQFTPPPAAPPTYTTPRPEPNGDAVADTNLLDARPFVVLAAPAPTHALYLEVAFETDDAGINHAYFNGISAPHAMGPPPLYDYLRGTVPPPSEADSLEGSPRYGATYGAPLPQIRHDSNAIYTVPFGAVIDVLVNNTDTGEHPFHFHGAWRVCGFLVEWVSSVGSTHGYEFRAVMRQTCAYRPARARAESVHTMRSSYASSPQWHTRRPFPVSCAQATFFGSCRLPITRRRRTVTWATGCGATSCPCPRAGGRACASSPTTPACGRCTGEPRRNGFELESSSVCK